MAVAVQNRAERFASVGAELVRAHHFYLRRLFVDNVHHSLCCAGIAGRILEFKGKCPVFRKGMGHLSIIIRDDNIFRRLVQDRCNIVVGRQRLRVLNSRSRNGSIHIFHY
ncbi:hypothetical protein D3C81_1882200 [compost metagenome]